MSEWRETTRPDGSKATILILSWGFGSGYEHTPEGFKPYTGLKARATEYEAKLAVVKSLKRRLQTVLAELEKAV